MKKEFKGRVIYNPSGKAGEYSYWAANFYVGCSNGCTYCYLKKGRGAKVLGGNKPELKKSLKSYDTALDIFKAELLTNKDELQKHGLFFSFTTDPLLSETIGLTTAAVEFGQLHNVPVKILSKCAEGMERFIDFATSSGYYIAETTQEINDYITSLEGRENAIKAVRVAMQKQLFDKQSNLFT